MKINILRWKELNAREQESFLNRSETDISNISQNVSEIIENVRQNGDAEIIKLAQKYDNAILTADTIAVSQEEIEEAIDSVPQELKEAIDFSIANVKKFHESQLNNKPEIIEIKPGVFAGEKMTAIDSLGLYVPQGRGKFPSMVYMLAVPANVAGVPRVCMTSPPNEDGKIDAACIYAAIQCGVSEIYKVGGAQAIAALCYGTETIERVAKISGPGNAYVTAAKRILYGKVDVGLPAGPSESVILADNTANPKLLAMDLITEAEHGSDSSALLLTDCEELAGQTAEYIKEFTEQLSPLRREFVADVMGNYGGIIITDNMDEAFDLANLIATEHLQVATKDPHKDLDKIRNAGEIILGQTPFSVANYSIGANAVLPTGANARTFSGVSARDFVKYSSVIYTTEEGLKPVAKHAKILAEYEGFDAHAKALDLDLRGDNDAEKL